MQQARTDKRQSISHDTSWNPQEGKTLSKGTAESEPHSVKRQRMMEQFTPKLISVFREGYGWDDLRADTIAGLTVAIVALPLAMAIGIASGTTPERALVTAIIAGGLISALGGSRVQIGGPTAAFIVVVFNVIQTHGIDGLILATFLAGIMLIILGFLRLAVLIKYLPYPVIVGVTAGIALSIFVSQIRELIGANVKLPGDFLGKMEVLWAALPQARWQTLLVAAISLVLILAIKRVLPRLPNMLAAVIICSLAVAALGLDADTIGTRFGAIPSSLPPLVFPQINLPRIIAIFPSAAMIALLAGIESLLSAVIADGLTGRRHRSNCELVAQGIANCASALFGGICATGALARTATNIRAGGRTPVAGIMHAVFLLLFMLVAAPLLSFVPLATLAAILTIVAWNIAEVHAINEILRHAPHGDRLALIVTFLLVVFTDITLAIEAGIVISAFFFMHHMAENAGIDRDRPDIASPDQQTFDTALADDDYVVFRLRGPFFFGAAAKIIQTLETIGTSPRAYVLDFAEVPFIDATAMSALIGFAAKARKSGSRLIIAGAAREMRAQLAGMGGALHGVDYTASVSEAVASLPKRAPPA